MGKGKGDFAPLPPPPIPWPGYVHSGLPVQPPMQHGLAPQMVPMAPPGSMTSSSGIPTMPAPPELPGGTTMYSPAQNQEEKELVEMIKSRQMELPADMRMKVQTYAKKEGARATKDLHTAVRQQGRARQDLEDALQARFNIVASWKAFLTDAIKTWQEYANLFQHQEKEVTERIQTAQEQFSMANVQLEQLQMAAGKVKTIEIKDDEEEMAEGKASVAIASEKIIDSFKTLSSSLQTLQTQTEQIETEMKAAKRPRLEIASLPDQVMEPSAEASTKPGGPPFHAADCP